MPQTPTMTERKLYCLGYDGLHPDSSGSYWTDGNVLEYHVGDDHYPVEPIDEVRWLQEAAELAGWELGERLIWLARQIRRHFGMDEDQING